MTDKKYKQTQRRIKKLCDEWISALGFGWFKIYVVYSKKPFTGKRHNWVASNCTLWEYREATITWNMPKAAIQSDENLKEYLFHELAHILVAEMRDWKPTRRGRKHEEHVCSHIENLIISTYQKGLSTTT